MPSNSFLTISRDALLKALQIVIGAVERRHTMQILSNVLLGISSGQLTVVGTDLEIELIGKVNLDSSCGNLKEITLSARKLIDICRALPENSLLQMGQNNNGRVTIICGSSRFTLAALSAQDFPKMPILKDFSHFSIKQSLLKALAEKIYFVIPEQKVRNYFNGLLLEINNGKIRAITSDGHRMAINVASIDLESDYSGQIIIPRKATMELMRLLEYSDKNLQVSLDKNFVQIQSEDFALTSKLIIGRSPNYNKLLQMGTDKKIIFDRDQLKHAVMRVAILSNEIFRTVRFEFQDNLLQLFSNNQEQEEAAEEIAIEYGWEPIEIIFSVSYLLDILNNLSSEKIIFCAKDGQTVTIIEEAETVNQTQCTHVLMPIRK